MYPNVLYVKLSNKPMLIDHWVAWDKNVQWNAETHWSFNEVGWRQNSPKLAFLIKALCYLGLKNSRHYADDDIVKIFFMFFKSTYYDTKVCSQESKC